jgi:alpha-galactosidase
MTRFLLAIPLTLFASPAAISSASTLPVDSLDLTQATQGWGKTQAGRSVDGKPLSIGGKPFATGVGTHASGEISIELDGRAENFSTKVGLDDETLPDKGSVEFVIGLDNKPVWRSGVMHTGDAPKNVNLPLHGARSLVLAVLDGGDGNKYDHADWAEAAIEYSGAKPEIRKGVTEERTVLTPPPAPKPRINGAKAYGARPGSPILFKIAASGEKPMTYEVKGLPEGLTLDAQTGILTGSIAKASSYEMTFTATNARGTAQRPFRLVIGDTLALTPPMGWNSWNVFGTQVDQKKVEAAAQAMISAGLIDFGWSYINVDDAWTNAPASDKPTIKGPFRNSDGSIAVNKKFPDMKAMVDAIHAKGLKAGIYSSPGPLTCGGYVGSFGFENEDATQYAKWGIDYLKYDWCGYDDISNTMVQRLRIAREDTLNVKAPYLEMAAYLQAQPRDIVYSLCQYGMGDVWKWGGSVGGNLWRTTGDIQDEWGSMSGIGFSQDEHAAYAGPGHWNDPDMLVVGKVGLQGNFWNYQYDRPNLKESRLTPNEQYTHMTLWSMLAAPLLIGCDMTDMDAFTKGLLTNAEVIDIDQDPLGKQARRISTDGEGEVWARPLEDGSVAIALFNRGPFPLKVTANLAACGVKEPGQTVRDVWRQKDIGPASPVCEATIARHGAQLIRVYKK